MPAGSEVDDYLSLYDASQDLTGDEYIGEVVVQIAVNDENYNRIIDGDVITIRTSDYDKDWGGTIDGDTIFSDSGFTVKLVSVTRGEYWPSTTFTFLLINDTDRTLNMDISGMLVNGADEYPWFYYDVYPGTMAVAALSVDDDSLADTGSETLDSLEISFTIYDNDTYEEVTASDGYISLPVGLG